MLAGLGYSLFYLFCVYDRICLIVSACYGNFSCRVFLNFLLSKFELVFCFVGLAFFERYCSKSDIIVCIFRICLYTCVEILLAPARSFSATAIRPR